MLFVKALIFGLTIAAAIGPIALLIMNHSMRSGIRTGMGAGLGAALADLTYALIAFGAGAALVHSLAAHEDTLHRIAGIVLVLFGAHMAWSALRRESLAPAGGATPRTLPGKALWTTYALTIVNPLTIILFAGFTAQIPANVSAPTIIWCAIGLFAGSLVVQAACAMSGALLGKMVTEPRAIRLLNLASAVGIIAFGVSGLM